MGKYSNDDDDRKVIFTDPSCPFDTRSEVSAINKDYEVQRKK